MPVTIHPPGTLLEDDHPLKGTRIHFGIKPPANWKENLRKQREAKRRRTNERALVQPDEGSIDV